MHRHLMIIPYTDTTIWPTFDISEVPFINTFALGFIIADQDQDPSWGGYYKLETNFYSDIISRVREKGGDVICSFGGAQGNELATDIKSESKLEKVYKDVIDKYNFKYLDFDIEGGAVYDHVSNIRRGRVLLSILKQRPYLYISLTVPVSQRGLSDDVLEMIRLTPHDLLNIMAMDFGNNKDMYKAVVESIESTRKQTKKPLGVTVMIGKNDTVEIFTLEDAKKLAEYIKKRPWIKRLSFWSIERDRGVQGELYLSSKVDQEPFEFTKTFISVF